MSADRVTTTTKSASELEVGDYLSNLGSIERIEPAAFSDWHAWLLLTVIVESSEGGGLWRAQPGDRYVFGSDEDARVRQSLMRIQLTVPTDLRVEIATASATQVRGAGA